MNDTRHRFVDYVKKYLATCTATASLTWILGIILVLARGDTVNWLLAILLLPTLFGAFALLVFVPAAYLDVRKSSED